MTLIICRPTSLTIKDTTIDFNETVSFEIGYYLGTKRPINFYWQLANLIARENGLNLTRGENKLRLKEDTFQVLNKNTSQITPVSTFDEMDEIMPPYHKYIRIFPPKGKNWINRLTNLEDKINSKRFPGLKPIIATTRINTDQGGESIKYTAVEIALLESYSIELVYN